MKSVITREGIYFLFIVTIILFGSVFRAVNQMMLLASLMCCVPLFITWRIGRVSLKNVVVRRSLPPRIFAGEPFVVQIEAENIRKRKVFSFGTWSAVAVDRIRPRRNEQNGKKKPEKGYEPAVYFEYIPEGGSVRKSYAGRLPQRGKYRAGPFSIQTKFPFGFFRHRFEQAESNSERNYFFVYPKIGNIHTGWLKQYRKLLGRSQERNLRPSRISGELLGIRTWQQGDAKRWIHWRASARHNELYVRQFTMRQNRDCAVILDLFQPKEVQTAADESIQRENFELAVSFAATLFSKTFSRNGIRLFFTTSRKEDDILSGMSSLPLTTAVLEILALAEPKADDALPEKLMRLIPSIGPDADVILVSPCPFAKYAEERFKDIDSSARLRTALRRLKIVDTSDTHLDSYFTIE
ncbi:MAG: DUF58 domain-containing protein [Planctomycetaceae bacterium]|nr:DUF58 domain-containing protein [Planctomycetaceae bacterium]